MPADARRRHAWRPAEPRARRARAIAGGRSRPPGPARSGTLRPRRRPRRRSRQARRAANFAAESSAVSGVNSTTSTSSTPPASNSSSRRSRLHNSSTRLPSALRGCGSNVTTVGRSPVSTAARITARCPRWTPSNVPSATARGNEASSLGWRATFTTAPRTRARSRGRAPRRDRAQHPAGVRVRRRPT